LTFLFNSSISDGVFPSTLKRAIITPLYKGKGKKDCVDNYRPVAVLPTLSKVFEKLVFRQLVEYLNKNNLVWIVDCIVVQSL